MLPRRGRPIATRRARFAARGGCPQARRARQAGRAERGTRTPTSPSKPEHPARRERSDGSGVTNRRCRRRDRRRGNASRRIGSAEIRRGRILRAATAADEEPTMRTSPNQSNFDVRRGECGEQRRRGSPTRRVGGAGMRRAANRDRVKTGDVNSADSIKGSISSSNPLQTSFLDLSPQWGEHEERTCQNGAQPVRRDNSSSPSGLVAEREGAQVESQREQRRACHTRDGPNSKRGILCT